MLKLDVKVGFIGTGVIGAAMASHILEGGYKLSVHR